MFMSRQHASVHLLARSQSSNVHVSLARICPSHRSLSVQQCSCLISTHLSISSLALSPAMFMSRQHASVHLLTRSQSSNVHVSSARICPSPRSLSVQQCSCLISMHLSISSLALSPAMFMSRQHASVHLLTRSQSSNVHVSLARICPSHRSLSVQQCSCLVSTHLSISSLALSPAMFMSHQHASVHLFFGRPIFISLIHPSSTLSSVRVLHLSSSYACTSSIISP